MRLKLLIFISFLFLSKYDVKSQDEEQTTEASEDYPTEAPDDSSNYANLNLPLTYYPNGGVLVQYTKNGLDYIIRMAEKAVVKFMKEFPIPDTDQDGFSMKKVKVNEFEQPQLHTRFVNQTGIEIKCILPKLEISGKYSGSVGWFSSSGTLRTNIVNLVVSMLIRIERGNQGFPAFKVPICSGKIERFSIVFSDQGWGGTLLNTMRGVVEGVVTTTLGNIICFAARNATELIETVFLDWDVDGPMVMDPKVICGEDLKQMQGAQGSGGGAAGAVLAELEGMSINMNLDGNAFFDDDEVVAGLQGDFVYKGKATGLTPTMLVLPHTDRMICFAVKEVVPNSFGIIAHENKFFELRKKLEVADLPPEIRTPVRLLCGSCKMQLYAVSKDPPKVHFTPSGVRAYVSTFMQIDGRGFFNTKINVLQAICEIEALTNLYIEKNTIKGSVNLGTINVKIQDVGLGGVFDKPLNALLRKLIPKAVWPIARDRINKAIEEKGFKLPAMCGLSFNNTEIIYVEGAVIVRTDFVYDLEGFIDRFAAWQIQQNALLATTASEQEDS